MTRLTIFLILMLTYSNILAQEVASVYVCPPCESQCDLLSFEAPGICSHCGMQLLEKASAEAPLQQKTIAFYLQHGVEVLDFAGPMEVFSYAGFKVYTVSKTKAPIVSQGILKVIPDYSIEDAPKADILAFFGGNGRASFQDKEVQKWIQEQHDVDYYFSVCTGVFALAETGILDQLTATTFHSALDDLEEDYPKIKVVKNARYIDNGKVITTAGISAGIDGALHLVARLQGFNAARSIAYHMEYDKWSPNDGQILTEENPYTKALAINYLQDYIGAYEFYDNQKLSIRYNQREHGLEAVLNDRTYPVFFQDKDLFHNLDNVRIFFTRDEKGKVKGFQTSAEKDVFLRKLD